MVNTLRLHYNAVLYKADSIITLSPPRHVENVIMMINNAGDVFLLCICTKRKHNL